MTFEQILGAVLTYGVLLVFVAYLGWFAFSSINDRCKRCSSLKYHWSKGRAYDSASGHAYLVCKACGHHTVAGNLGSDGRVHWYTGSTGSFLEDGIYFGGGGDGGGGGGGGGGGDGGG